MRTSSLTPIEIPQSAFLSLPSRDSNHESSMRFSFSDVKHIPTSNSNMSTPKGQAPTINLNPTNTFQVGASRASLNKRMTYRFPYPTHQALRKQFVKKSLGGKMSQNQFRECMGILGLQTTSFISDRIFSVVDQNADGLIECPQFLRVMDTLMNGSKTEKLRLSFHLLDLEGKGIISYLDFSRAVRKVMSLWYTMTGNQVRIQEEDLKELFKTLDKDRDHFVSITDYVKAFSDDPNVFQWSDLLSTGFTMSPPMKKKKHRKVHSRNISTGSEIERPAQEPVSAQAIQKTKDLKKEVAEAISLLEQLNSSAQSSDHTFQSDSRTASPMGRNFNIPHNISRESAETSRRPTNGRINANLSQIYEGDEEKSPTGTFQILDDPSLQIDLSEQPNYSPLFPQFRMIGKVEGSASSEDESPQEWVNFLAQNLRESTRKDYRSLSNASSATPVTSKQHIQKSFFNNDRLTQHLSHLIQQAQKKARFEQIPSKQGDDEDYIPPDPEQDEEEEKDNNQREDLSPLQRVSSSQFYSPQGFIVERKASKAFSLVENEFLSNNQEELRQIINASKILERPALAALNGGAQTLSDGTVRSSDLELRKEQLMEKLSKIQNFTSQLLQQFQENKALNTEPSPFSRTTSDSLGFTLHEFKNRPRFGSNFVEDESKAENHSQRNSIQSSDHASIKSSRPSILLLNIPRSKAPTVIRHKQMSGMVTFGHQNWNLVLNMMLGIRNSVRSLLHQEILSLEPQQFDSRYYFELVPKRTADNSRLKLYHFFDFAPKVFHKLRHFYGITDDEYLKSIGPQNLIGNLLMGNMFSLEEQCSAGKSGSFFYYSNDGKFMLKTITKSEFHFLRKILKDYYQHLEKNAHTLITRFYGLHKLKFQKNKKYQRIYFVIMGNVFMTGRQIDLRYDLKGSFLGRKVLKDEQEFHDPSTALKDIDFMNKNQPLQFQENSKNLLLQQIKEDTEFFIQHHILDYSLLVGISNLRNGESLDIKRRNEISIEQLSRTNPNYSQLTNAPSVFGRIKPFYERHDGGILSKDETKLYFIGIIDILTLFNTKKKFEYFYKKFKYHNNKFSCVPPAQYADRFRHFMSDVVIK